ncbi:MAG: hypothetical protein N4J56_007173 [Chroococcidiopsis sp. SAG 2025]|nr:hypothetical protein [Chroococcidiopsis sp. SAG 2025]
MYQQFEMVQIPPAVLSELKVQEDRPGSKEIQAALKAGWIQVQAVNSLSSRKLLQQTLDRGEAEAIALAMELQADWTLLRRTRWTQGCQVPWVKGHWSFGDSTAGETKRRITLSVGSDRCSGSNCRVSDCTRLAGESYCRRKPKLSVVYIIVLPCLDR